MTTLSWLHITDIHIGMRDRGLWAGSKQILLDDLTRTTERLGPWDLVLLTGDLAFSGTADEYRQVDAALDDIWRVLCKPHPNAASPLLIAVPGNHDLARPDKEDPIARALLTDDKAREGLWKERPQTVEAVRSWFAEYTTWWNGCKYRPRTGLSEGLLPGDFLYSHRKGDLEIGLTGMNSAFLDVSDEVGEGQLWMDVRQLGRANKDLPGWLRRHSITLLLTHHPVKWLSPGAQKHYRAAIAPAGRFTAHLCGHLHESFAEERSVGTGEASRIWQAPSFFGMEVIRGMTERRHGYTAGQLSVEGGHLRSRRWPRQAFKGQDGAYRVTADITYRLKDDLLETPEEELPWTSGPSRAPGTAPPVLTAAPSGPKSWREAASASGLWKSSTAGLDASRVAVLAEVAGEIIDVCRDTCQRAEAVIPGDPWRDERYPTRVLDRLDVVIGNPLSAEEAVLLLVTPFVREAIFAAGALWMASVKPCSVEDTGATTEPRNTLEQIHRGRPDLLRRLECLEGADRDAVCHWMMGQALQRSPHLRDRAPKIAPMRELQRRIEAAAAKSGCAAWLDMERLVRLAWCVATPPEALEGESGPLREGVVERGGARLRLPVMAQLLSLSGLQALDIRTADELVVDHIGREGFTPAMLRDSLRAAAWTGSEGRHQVALACDHPVVDFALEDMAARARAAAERIRQTTQDEGRPFMNVPAGIAAHTEPATGPDGRPRYRRPLIRFRLDHTKIRELLMGEQLYGDPTLAIRELYQNALDACRYRQVRARYLVQKGDFLEEAPYEGRIRFRQGVDAAGKGYIECEDNGVGMTPAILEHVFAVAGQRFHDLPEFVEERAAWQRCTPPLQLYPNSQFGVGVLSYFMLADEIVVTTRRYERDGRLGKVLTMRISSASGLFRLEEGRDEEMTDAGTRVRLLLARDSYHVESKVVPISVSDTLGKLLWIAEFDTTVEELGQAHLRWPAGTPAPGGEPPPPWRFCATEDPDVHWVGTDEELLYADLRSGGVNSPLRVPVLVDGIATEQTSVAVLINLRGPRYPRLTVDRRNIREWCSDWTEVLAASARKLIGWAGLTFQWLWALERDHLRAARAVVEHLTQADARLPAHVHAPEVTASVRDLGCFDADRGVFVRLRKGWRPAHLWEAWRAAALIAARFVQPPSGWSPPPRLADLRLPAPPPGLSSLMVTVDSRDLRHNPEWGLHWHDDEVPLHKVVLPAARCRTTLADVAEWVTPFLPLGIPLPAIPDGSRNVVPLQTDVELLSLVDSSFYGSATPIPVGVVLKAAEHLSWSVKDVLLRSVAFGRVVPQVDWERVDSVLPTETAVRLLSRDLDGAHPWLDADVPAAHVRRACHWLEMSLQAVLDVFQSLAPLGIRVQSTVPESISKVSGQDECLLSVNLDAQWPWLHGDVPLGHVVAASLKFETRPSQIAERLKGLAASRGLRIPAVPWARLDTLEFVERDLMWLSMNGDGKPPWRGMIVFVGSILGVMHDTGMDVTGLADRFREIGVELRGDTERLSSGAGLTFQERTLLSRKHSGQAPWLQGEASAAHVILVAHAIESSIEESLSMAARFGLVTDPVRAALAALGDHPPDEVDAHLVESFDFPASDAADAYERGVARACLRVWALSEADLLARIERLRPALDQILAENLRTKPPPGEG